MRLHESVLRSDPNLEMALDACEVSEQDERLKVIYFDGESTAVAGLKLGSGWRLLAESSQYEPSGGDFDEETELPPFDTTGEWWLVEPKEGNVAREEFHFEEGQIQGLVYALHSIIYGGELRPSQYVNWLIEESERLQAEAEGEEEHEVISPRDRLIYILCEAGLVEMHKVEIPVGYGVK